MNKHLFTPSSQLTKTNSKRTAIDKRHSKTTHNGGGYVATSSPSNSYMIQKYRKYKERYQNLMQTGGSIR